jgi:serine/threonine protein phosphatase PrpC
MENAAPEPAPPGRGDEAGAAAYAVEAAAHSETGPVRPRNEDRWGHHREDAATALVVVADGVSGFVAGDVASQMAVDLTLGAYREQDAGTRIDLRLARAVQHANIGIHDRALVVPELRGMATTLTAVVVARGQMAVAHVGDSRLYLVRRGRALQLTKDHTAGRSVLTRSVGRELIVAIDRITRPLVQGDVLVTCTDGLYNVLQDADIAELVGGVGPDVACRALVEAALARKTNDNATAAVIRVVGPTPDAKPGRGVAARLRRLLGHAE